MKNKIIFLLLILVGFASYGQVQQINGQLRILNIPLKSAADSVLVSDGSRIIGYVPLSMLQQELSLSGTDLSISQGNTVDLSGLSGSSGAWGTIPGTLSDQTDLNSALISKQDNLISGTNIRTINGLSVLGSGDLTISGGGAEVNDLTSIVTWANIPDLNITQSSVVQHEGALTITESQISDLSHTPNQNLSQVLTEGNDAGGLKIANLADPTLAQDATTKVYVDGLNATSAKLGSTQTFTGVNTFGQTIKGGIRSDGTNWVGGYTSLTSEGITINSTDDTSTLRITNREGIDESNRIGFRAKTSWESDIIEFDYGPDDRWELDGSPIITAANAASNGVGNQTLSQVLAEGNVMDSNITLDSDTTRSIGNITNNLASIYNRIYIFKPNTSDPPFNSSNLGQTFYRSDLQRITYWDGTAYNRLATLDDIPSPSSDNQTLSLIGSALSIEDGNTVNLPQPLSSANQFVPSGQLRTIIPGASGRLALQDSGGRTWFEVESNGIAQSEGNGYIGENITFREHGGTNDNSISINFDFNTGTDQTMVLTPTTATYAGQNMLSVGAGGTGNVTKVGTPLNNQLGVWTGDGTIEGDPAVTWNGSIFAVAGDVILDPSGTTTAAPGIIGFDGFSTGEATRFQFGDRHNSIQNGFNQWMDISAYHTLRITGGQQGTPTNIDFQTAAPGAGDDIGVLVSTLDVDRSSLVVKGIAAQTVDLFQVRDEADAVIVAVNTSDQLDLNSNKIINLADPTNPQDAATKAYVDANAGGSGNVTKVGTPVNDQIGVWTGDGTLEGAPLLTHDGATTTFRSNGSANMIIFRDASNNIKARFNASGDFTGWERIFNNHVDIINRVNLSNTAYFGWSADGTPTNASDTGISRLSAGSIAIGNGTVGNTSGSVTAAQFIGGGAGLTEVVKSDVTGLTGASVIENIVSGTQAEIDGWAADASRLDLCEDCPPAVQTTGTVLDLGDYTQYNMESANTGGSYTLTNIKGGGYAEVLINAGSAPSVTGATPLPNTAAFIASTDMILSVKAFGTTVKYWFTEY